MGRRKMVIAKELLQHAITGGADSWIPKDPIKKPRIIDVRNSPDKENCIELLLESESFTGSNSEGWATVQSWTMTVVRSFGRSVQ